MDFPLPPEGKIGWPWTEDYVNRAKRLQHEKKWPKISIITPSYNQGIFLEETIKSVLLQDYPNLEYIIIDGGSTDNSVEIIKKYQKWIKYWCSEPDNGQSEAINKGFEKSSGEIIAWLNSDDVYLPGTLFKIAEKFMIKSDIDLIYGDIEIIDEKSKKQHLIKSGQFKLENLLNFDFIPQPATFFRRRIWISLGGLNEQYHYAMDYDLILHICLISPIEYISEPLSQFRLYSTSKCGSKEGYFLAEEFHFFDKYLQIFDLDCRLSFVAYIHLLRNLVTLKISDYISYSVSPINYLYELYKGNLFCEPELELIHCYLQERPISKISPENLLEVTKSLFTKFSERYKLEGDVVALRNEWSNAQLIFFSHFLWNNFHTKQSLNLFYHSIRFHPSLLFSKMALQYLIKFLLGHKIIKTFRIRILRK